MFQALEQNLEPREFLGRLADHLKTTGSHLIEDPDLQTSPFDMLITGN
jgi:hypothetical protein